MFRRAQTILQTHTVTRKLLLSPPLRSFSALALLETTLKIQVRPKFTLKSELRDFPNVMPIYDYIPGRGFVPFRGEQTYHQCKVYTSIPISYEGPTFKEVMSQAITNLSSSEQLVALTALADFHRYPEEDKAFSVPFTDIVCHSSREERTFILRELLKNLTDENWCILQSTQEDDKRKNSFIFSRLLGESFSLLSDFSALNENKQICFIKTLYALDLLKGFVVRLQKSGSPDSFTDKALSFIKEQERKRSQARVEEERKRSHARVGEAILGGVISSITLGLTFFKSTLQDSKVDAPNTQPILKSSSVKGVR